MPGVLGAASLSFGVVVVAPTFGQAIDGVEALEITCSPGPLADQCNGTVRPALPARTRRRRERAPCRTTANERQGRR
jgi:isoquinoline 1-oxidoreductase beta subunit